MAGRFLIAGMTAAASGLLFVLGGTAATDAPAADDRPSLSPIQATFVENLKATRYVVNLDDPGAGPETPLPNWEWDLTPPADDPGCDELEIPVSSARSSSVTWYHADENGCKHVGTEHFGRIDVVVRTRGWTCDATIVGTSTHVGPEPNQCFKPTPPAPPPPASSSAPSIRDLEKKQWRDTSVATTAIGVTFAGMALGCALAPEPASKVVAVLGFIAAGAYYAVGVYAFYKSEDPPDKNYKRLARLVIPKLPAVKTGSGATTAEAAAANALLSTIARISANDAAFIASFERAQGAYAARDGTWDRRQSRAAASFARAEARLFDTMPGLETALGRAVQQASVSPLTQADARRALDHGAKQGLPASFTATAAKLGVDAAAMRAFAKRLSRAKPGVIAGPVAPKFAAPAAAAADRAAARLLRTLAARLDKR